MSTHSNVGSSKFLSIFVIASLLLTVLGACSQQTTSGSQNNSKPIVIGASISNAGDFSADGKPTRQGYELWANTINQRGGLLGRQVKLDLVSDNSTGESATTAYQKLINQDHVDLTVGPFADETAVAAARVAGRSGYALIDGSGTAEADFQQGLTNMFSVSLPAKNYMKSFADLILSIPLDKRPKTAAYAAQDDPFLGPQVQEARALLEPAGVKTVVNIKYPAETTDYTPYVQQVIASKADIVLLGTATADSIAFVKGFKQQHYNPKAAIFASGPDQGDQFTGPLGGANVAEGIFVPNGGWYADINTFQNSQFQQDYVKAYGGTVQNISSDTVQAYSVMQVLEEAVNKVHSIDNAKILQDLHTDTFNTLQGPVKFLPDGENSVAVAFLFQWQKGNLIPVYPPSNAQQTPEYPKTTWS